MIKILSNLEFNKEPPYYMHIDLNSCFATIEQQANPLLRNIPIAVAAYNSPRGVILAPSIEAKRFGVKVGFRVEDAKKICPKIKILTPDADKYRFVHRQLHHLLSGYTDLVLPKSVDEFVLNLKGAPKYKQGLISLGMEIKTKIKDSLGEYITVSIGISKNQFLAKTASNLKKPDGLEEINENNYLAVYKKLKLTDLCGIAEKTMIRLNKHSIFTVNDFYQAPSYILQNAFGSIVGHYWYLRLRGYEIEKYKRKRKSFSQQYALPKPMKNITELTPVLTKLVEKMGFRLRKSGYRAQNVGLWLYYTDRSSWQKVRKARAALFDSKEIYREILELFLISPQKEVNNIGVSCFNLIAKCKLQLDLFEDVQKAERLTKVLDRINRRWGKFVVSPAGMLSKKEYVPDRIGFGNID